MTEDWAQLEARKRAELEESIRADLLADPITAIVSIATLKALAVSTAITAASYFIGRATQPKPPTLRQGALQGPLQLQNSEQGILIPEIYGAGPTVTLTSGSNPTYTNLANVSTGSGGAITKPGGGAVWNAGASHSTAIVAGQDAFYEFTVGSGYATAGFTTNASPTNGNTDFLFALQWNPDGSVTVKYNGTQLLANVTQWTAGDRFRLELRSGRFRIYKGVAEIVPQGMIMPTPAYPLYAGIAIMTVGAGVSESKVLIGNIGLPSNAGRGGVKIPAIIVWTSGIRKNVSTSQQPTGGGKGHSGTQSVENITYDIDLGLEFCRGPVTLLREYANADLLINQQAQSAQPSGVYDPTVGADAAYDPLAPPDPTVSYNQPIQRVDNTIPLDGDGVGSGTVQGGGSLFTIYPGNALQDPDPTIEADIDAKYGSGSTPAYRNHSLIVHKTFQLSRYGGVVPNLTAVWEHQTLKTAAQIFGALTERVGLTSSDYDYSSLASVTCRGMLLSGRLFTPAEVIDEEAIKLAYSYFVTEADGKLLAYAEGTEPVLTISDNEVGWLDSDAQLPDVVPEVASQLAEEAKLARQVDVRFIDPDNEWDSNTQSAKRQITDGSTTDLLEVQLTLLADEARAVAQRKLYRDYVAGSVVQFTLSWTYLYLYPGYKIIINRAEGFSHTIRLTAINGGLGVLECEGVALEPEVYNQPATGAFNGLPDPKQQVPAMTVIALLDVPALRDGDETNNSGIAQYVVGVPRTGSDPQNWQGFALYIQRNGEWQVLASSNIAGTIGTVVSASLLSNDPTTIDYTGRIVVDLYGTNAKLSSVATADIKLNLAVCDKMVFYFATATQIAGFDNRWELSVLLNGQKDTVDAVAAVAAGDRFVYIDDAVQFVPMTAADINLTENYKAVTAGQSLGDAATVMHAWTGQILRGHMISNLNLAQDGYGDWMIQFDGNPRPAEIPADYIIEVWTDQTRNNPALLLRKLPVTQGRTQAALLATVNPSSSTIGGSKPYRVVQSTHMNRNNMYSIGDGGKDATTLYIFDELYGRFDFTCYTISPPPSFATDKLKVGLTEDGTSNALAFTAATCPMYIELNDGSGTSVDVKIYNYTTLVTTVNIADADVTGGVRFTILIVGNEYRLYRDYSFNKPPLAVVATPGTGPTFPLRGIVHMPLSQNIDVLNMQIGNGIQYATIYSLREQTIDGKNGAPALDLRVYQVGRPPQPDGWPFDTHIQTLGGLVLLESGGADNLLTEAGDNLLKE